MWLKKVTSIAVIGVLAYVLADEAWAQTTSCTTTAASFTENFTTVDYRDDATSASGWGQGAVKLQFKGNSFTSSASTIGEAVYVAGAGDFDGDGWVDLAAIILSPNRLHFLKNLGINTDGSHKGFSNGGAVNSTAWKAQVIDAALPAFNQDGPAIYTGDFDGDGDPDIMYMKTNDQTKAGNIDNAYAYRNDGVSSSGMPVFTRLDFSALFKASGASYHRTTTWGTVIDFDKDGLDDFICTSSHTNVNEVLLFRSKTKGKIDFSTAISIIPNIGLVGPFADSSHAFNAGGCLVASQQGKYYSQGGSSIAVGDLDGDGDNDVIVGSVNEQNLKYWRNDGSDVFTKMPDVIWSAQGLFVAGAPTFIIIGDFDGDGDGDIVTGRDGYYCNGFQGTAWFFANNGDGTSFTQKTTPLLNAGADLDFGVKLYIDENIKYPNLNKSADMTLDLIAADGNNSGQYYPVLGQRSNVYNVQNKAFSKIIDELDNNGNAIVSAQMSGLSQTLPSGTTIDYLVSNDNGATWEQLTPEEVYTSGSAKAHTFTHFGSDFRWEAVLNAPKATLTGSEASLDPGAKVTPILSKIAFNYNYVTRREYSRSSLAYGNGLSVTNASTSTNETKNLVFSSTFFYPGYEGTLRAYKADTALQTTSEANNDLNQAVVKSGTGTATQWDAGEILRGTSAASRTLYTSLPKSSANPDLTALNRVSFVASNASTLSGTMATDDDTASKVISFVRAGMGSSNGTKLYDVGHSSPVFVGAPINNTSDPSLTSDNYTNFVTQQASRQPVVYIGSNSGMVHAFNAQTGSELWAYVPYNLLAKLKTQMATNTAGNATYQHQYMVDGAVVVRDVYDRDLSKWRTVLIAGEALGQGRGDNNYYFALDVTDPANPQPLWEFTDAWAADSMACSGSYTQNICTTTTPQDCTKSCSATNHVFNVNAANTPANWIAIEAEDYGSNKSLDGKSSWNATTTPGAYYSSGAVVSASTKSSPSACTNASTNTSSCGAILTYALSIATPGDYKVYFRYSTTASKAIRYQLGSLDEPLTFSSSSGAWAWTAGNTVSLVTNSYNLSVDLVDFGVSIDKIIIVPASASAPTGSTPTEYCASTCTAGTPVETCVPTPFSPSAESYECGTGSGYKCCQDSSSSTKFFCARVGSSCDDIDTVLGQTWSQPVVAPVKISTNRRWLTMFASGYNNRASLPAATGRSAYAIDTISGDLVGQWDYNDVTYNKSTNPSTIDNTIPGGISVYDYTTNGTDDTPDGYADVAYLGDLEGRLWKIDFSRSATMPTSSTVPLSTWPTCVMFDAADPDKTGLRDWAPIITTPAVTTITADTAPHKPIVYFGTGGDDRAPSVPTRTSQYRFYAIKDAVSCPAVATPTYTTALTQSVVFATDNAAHYQWIVGDGKDVNNAPLQISTAEGTSGQRYWSDPVIFNNSIVYFASLGGSIESVNPCDNLTDASLLYGYAIRPIRDSDGRQIAAGTSTVKASLNSGAYYRSSSKIRRAVLTAGQAPTAGVAQAPSATGTSATAAATQIFIQTFDGNVRAITPPTVVDTNTIRVLRWREIPLY